MKAKYYITRRLSAKGFLATTGMLTLLFPLQYSSALDEPLSMKPLRAIEVALKLQDVLETRIVQTSDIEKKSELGQKTSGTNISVKTNSSTGNAVAQQVQVNGQTIVPPQDVKSSSDNNMSLQGDTDVTIRYRQSVENGSGSDSNFSIRINGESVADER